MTAECERLVEEHIYIAELVVHRYFMRSGYEHEDLVQEALLAIVMAAEKYDPERGAFATLAATVAFNWIASRIVLRGNRLRYRANRYTMSLDEPINGEDGGTYVEGVPSGNEPFDETIARRDLVDHMLSRLNKRDRQDVIAYYLDDRTYRDIADERGLTYQAVQSRVTHAIAWLQTLYGQSPGMREAV